MKLPTDEDEAFGEVLCDFAWGFVWMSFLTYPVTTYFFPATWSDLSLGTAISILAVTWVVVTLMVQPGRDFLKRRTK